MHNEAMAWVAQYATNEPVSVLDLGGRDINGSPRSLFPGATAYTVIDIQPGNGVDFVADAATWVPDRTYDYVCATEVFEHTPTWPAICRTAWEACNPGGWFIATMAGPGRPEHSAIDGGWTLYPGEHYRNITPAELLAELESIGWCDVIVDQQPSPADVRSVARKPLLTD
jgi:Methyltransferase domain